MTAFDRSCLKAAMKHLMADADDSVLSFDKGMDMLLELSKPPYTGQRQALESMRSAANVATFE